MFKTAKLQIRQRRYQPNLALPNLTFDFGGYDYWRYWRVRQWRFGNLAFVSAAQPSQ